MTQPDPEKYLGDCPICFEPMNINDTNQKVAVFFSCGHVFHQKCIGTWINHQANTANKNECSHCRTKMHSIVDINTRQPTIIGGGGGGRNTIMTSANDLAKKKIDEIKKEIDTHRQAARSKSNIAAQLQGVKEDRKALGYLFTQAQIHRGLTTTPKSSTTSTEQAYLLEALYKIGLRNNKLLNEALDQKTKEITRLEQDDSIDVATLQNERIQVSDLKNELKARGREIPDDEALERMGRMILARRAERSKRNKVLEQRQRIRRQREGEGQDHRTFGGSSVPINQASKDQLMNDFLDSQATSVQQKQKH